MQQARKLTTIAIDPDVKIALQSLGHAGQSYNDVLKEILKKAEGKK